MKNSCAYLMLLGMMLACQQKNESGGEAKIEELYSVAQDNPQQATTKFVPPMAVPNQKITESADQVAITRKIIRNADTNFRVLDTKKSLIAINLLIQKFKGIITTSNQNTDANRLNYSLTLRIPAQNLDAFLAEISKESIYTDYQNVISEDVTAEWVDVETRIRSKKLVEQKYLDLLKKARNVAEVIQVEEQLRIIREEIEAKESRMKVLQHDVAMSTVSLTMYELHDIAIAPEAPFYQRIGNNISDGFRAMLSFIYGFFYFLPFIPIAILLLWGIKKLWRKQ